MSQSRVPPGSACSQWASTTEEPIYNSTCMCVGCALIMGLLLNELQPIFSELHLKLPIYCAGMRSGWNFLFRLAYV